MKRTYIIGLLAVVAIVVIIILVNNSSPSVSNYSNLNNNNTTTDTSSTTSSMKITSAAFANNDSIPAKYTCDAPKPISPPLTFSGIPSNASSLTLIVDDPDVPKQLLPAGVFDHWVQYNIPANTTAIGENTSAGTSGKNGRGQPGYTPPCPPPQYQPNEHRYIFTLYALDRNLDLSQGATKQQVIDAMQGHIIEQAQLIGRYKRVTTSTP